MTQQEGIIKTFEEELIKIKNQQELDLEQLNFALLALEEAEKDVKTANRAALKAPEMMLADELKEVIDMSAPAPPCKLRYAPDVRTGPH